ncbi:hypothetical protein MBLNU230_g5445t1 [Neophaeotheca triangularis]
MWKPSMPNLGPLNKPIRFIRRQLPEWNFITIHYTYFILTCLLFATIFWGSSTPPRSVSYVDSLFLVVSAMTLAGLNTVNLSELNTFQQVLLFVLIMLGSAIFVSAFVVLVRKRAFRKKFEDVIMEQRARRDRVREESRSVSRARGWNMNRRGGKNVVDEEKAAEDAKLADSTADPTEPDMLDGVIEDSRERDLTPPARRGAAEMNGISSKTGERISIGDAQVLVSPIEARQGGGITWRGDTRTGPPNRTLDLPPVLMKRQRTLLDFSGVGARPLANFSTIQPGVTLARYDSGLTPKPKSRGDITQYIHEATGWISRNSQFHGLTDDERDRLGGCEYRAISFLAWLVPAYFIAWQVLTCIALGAYVHNNRRDTVQTNGLNAYWVGAFNAVSAFNNSGMSLLDANMTAFATSYYMLLTMSLLILAGNTCYPIFLRIIIWSMLKLMPARLAGPVWDERRKTLNFLLDHPRRCYTNLFPRKETYWLALSVIALNGFDWAMFELLNLNNEVLAANLPLRYRIITGLFQAFAVRSGGFYVVSMSTLTIATQILYATMMYISVYPVVITMRNSNVYEERSLGLYSEDLPETPPSSRPSTPTTSSSASTTTPPAHPPARQNPSGFLLHRARTLAANLSNPFAPSPSTNKEAETTNSTFVRQQLRAQLAHDAWWIIVAVFLITILENDKFEHDDPRVFSVFNFIFEVVSAYGCVGISVGLPTAAYSFCGAWGAISKLILVAVMLRGRHRGLPVAIDKAVLLPSELQGRAEEEDGVLRRVRSVGVGGGEWEWERGRGRGKGEGDGEV